MQEYLVQAASMATVLGNGKMPVKYTIAQDEYVEANINQNTVKIVVISLASIALLIAVYLVIKYRLAGGVGILNILGLTAIYVLLIRYVSVQITLTAMIGAIVLIIVQTVIIERMLNKMKKEIVNGSDYVVAAKQSVMGILKKSLFVLVPLLVIFIVFVFIRRIELSSLGIVGFWGVISIAIYNLVVSKMFFKEMGEFITNKKLLGIKSK